jgi:PAS domain S-box-containing protein
MIRILLVEDSPSDAELLQEAVRQVAYDQFHFTHVETLTEALAQARQQRFDVMLLDLSLPDSTGRETFLRARAAAPDLPIVVMTGLVDEATGLEAVREGIQDYLSKGHADGAQIARAVRYAVERQRTEFELRQARDELAQRVAERTADLRRSVEGLQREITQRQEAEEAVRQSEERYRMLLEAAPVGIVISNRRGEIFSFNRFMCALAGITPQEVRGLNATSFYAVPGQRRQLMARMRKHGRIEQQEVWFRRKDGSPYLGLLRMEEVHLGDEKLLLTLVRDITQQRQTERHVEGVRELLELFATKPSRQEYVDAVVESLRRRSACRCVGIRLVGRRGCLPYIGSVGYARDFLKQESCLSLDTADCPCARIFHERRLHTDAQFTTGQGSFFCNHTSRAAADIFPHPESPATTVCLAAGYETLAHVPIRYHGRLFGSIHLADRRQDRLAPETVSLIESVAPLIGEALHRFEVEESLTQSEQRFRTLFEGHNAPMLLVDPEPCTIEDANPAAASYYGYSRQQLKTMKVQDLCAVPPQTAESLRQRARGETRDVAAFPHRLASGEIRTVEVHSSPVEIKGRRLLFSIIHDVTERKLLERQILDIGEAERQRIGRDLHDSVGGLLTGAALISKALASHLAATGSSESEVAEEVVRTINDAIAQTRAISRGLFPAELSTAGLIAGLKELTAETAKRAGISCRLKADPGVRIQDASVAAHLFRISQEAVNNALRHANARQITIRLARLGDEVLLEIQNDGRDLLPHWETSPGTGLRSMRYRADVIGAHFSMKSGQGRGTVVSCLLPLRSIGPPKPN